jgi:cytochrome c6
MKSSHRSLALLLSPLLIPVFALAAMGASDVWMEHCARCHGADGTANTKIGKKLKLSDYSSATVQARMTDDEIFKATADGVFDDKGKERMPGYKEKLSEKEMRDLVKQVRAFKK